MGGLFVCVCSCVKCCCYLSIAVTEVKCVYVYVCMHVLMGGQRNRIKSERMNSVL